MTNQYGDRPLPDRFWAKVDQSAGPDKCWPWTGARFWFGHGAVKVNGRPWGAHRIAWELANDDVVPSDLSVLHHCDNPPCCNPSHLYLGTAKDNSGDMVRRGRASFGDRHPGAKLTASNVWIARMRVRNGTLVSAIAPSMGVSVGTLDRAVHGETWRHVADPVPRRKRAA